VKMIGKGNLFRL